MAILNDVHTTHAIGMRALVCVRAYTVYPCFVNYKRTRNYACYLRSRDRLDGVGGGISKQECVANDSNTIVYEYI